MSLPQDDYLAMDGVALAEAVARRDLCAREVLDAALARADAAQGLNAVVRRYDAVGEAMADAVTPCASPLAGVPTLMKDVGGQMAGMAFRAGSRWIPETVQGSDNAFAAGVRRAGMAAFGVTNAPEFGLPCFTEPVIYGPAINPRAPGLTPGGSSGGAAAAVAAGVVPIAHATDGGGSIRIPASCCGLVGLKASRGRLSLAPDGEWASGTAMPGFVTRTVRDSAAALDAVAGFHPGDPYTAPGETDFLSGLEREEGRPLRIASATGPFEGHRIDPVVAEAVRDTAAACEALGHHVEEAQPAMISANESDPRRREAFLTMYSVSLAAALDSWAAFLGKPPNPVELEGLTWSTYQAGKAVAATDHLRALWLLSGVARAFARFFETFDVWLTPTLASPPLPLGTFDMASPGASMQTPIMRAFNPLGPLYNISGQPALSLPAGEAAGAPVGVTLGGAMGSEAMLLRLARALELARPWPLAVHDLPEATR